MAYPRRLRGLAEAPAHLDVRGLLGDRERAVAIVGARAAPTSAVDAARGLARALAAAGATIVSGGALGIDAAAHQGALDAVAAGPSQPPGSATVVVLGCGIDVVYPARHARLFDQICAAGGALVSQFPLGAQPRSWHFVRRNQTIAGMADAVIVIAASASSGALHTAAAARRLGRVVCAMPGSAGCEMLLASGAALVETAADVWRALDGQPARPTSTLPEPGTPAARILDFLHLDQAQDHDRIAAHTGLAAREVARALTGLELQGLAIALPGHNYVRSVLAHELLAR